MHEAGNVTWLPHFTIIYALWILNVEICKSREKNVLLYISKQDDLPFFNCRETELPFVYRARAWAQCTEVFCFSDPFVLEHEQHSSCFINYIGTYEVDFYVSNQCLSLFGTFGLADECSCCYDCTLYLVERIGKVCIYTDPRVSENPLYLRNHLCFWVGTMVHVTAREFLSWIVCAM